VFDLSRVNKKGAWKRRRFTAWREDHIAEGQIAEDQIQGTQIPEDRSVMFSEQEQSMAFDDIEAERVRRASIRMHGRRAFPTLRSKGNESGAASGHRAPRSFGRGNDLAQVEGVGQRRSDGGTNFRNRRRTDEGGALRGHREGQTHVRGRQGGGQGKRESRRGRETGKKREVEQGEMDETADAEFERLDNLFDKMMLSEFEQLQEALISGPREQVYERFNQRRFEQDVLEPTPTIAQELSDSQDAAVTASLLGVPSRTAPVRASPAAHKANLARQQRRMEQQGEYGKWLPTELQNLGGTDFAKLSGTAPVTGLQFLLAKKPEIGLKYREANDTKIVAFLKNKAPELIVESTDPATRRQQPAVSPCRTFLSFYTSLISFTDAPELRSYRIWFNILI